MFKPGQKDCNCHTSFSPIYAVVSSHLDSPESSRALVTMRGKVHVNSTDGLRSLMPAETYDLSFALIYQALLTSSKVLYFNRNTDQELFLTVYPEFRGEL